MSNVNIKQSKSDYNTFKREISAGIDAAALQNDIALRYNLPGMTMVFLVLSYSVNCKFRAIVKISTA